MAAAQPTISCRSLYKKSEIPPVQCQYTLSLIKSSNEFNYTQY
jgi:hypothetical protein